MAKVITTPGQDLRKIAEIAGGNPDLTLFDPPTNELEVTDVTQAALDAALATYVADQTNIDAATAASRVTISRDGEKEAYDNKRLFRALVEVLLDEINALRTIEGLPDRTLAQARTAIQGKIDSL
jgi:predicted DNA-binding protein (UPF0251 family)